MSQQNNHDCIQVDDIYRIQQKLNEHDLKFAKQESDHSWMKDTLNVFKVMAQDITSIKQDITGMKTAIKFQWALLSVLIASVLGVAFFVIKSTVS